MSQNEAPQSQTPLYRVPKLITKKQRDFYVAWKATMFDPAMAKDCLRSAGYSESVIGGGGHSVKQSIGGLIKGELEKAGLTGKAMAKEHARLAFKSESPSNPGMPDNPIRLRALQEAHKLKDDYPVTKIAIDQHHDGEVTLSLDTMRRAERNSGERIIDVTPEVDLVTDGDDGDTDELLEPI